MKLRPVEIEITPRLAREAERWRELGRRPERIEAAAPGQTSVWSFPRPPAVERVLERVTVEWGGEQVVDTKLALRVCETAAPPTYYIPKDEFLAGVLCDAPGGSHCEWKGRAIYHSLRVGARVSESAAWSYPRPQPEYAMLAGFVGIYASRVDHCSVGGVDVVPQEGGFYAGWITPDLVGPFKGGAGSEGW